MARVNFDAAGKKINACGKYNNLDALWSSPSNGASIFVGNQTAARSLDILDKNHITCVVNCTDCMPNYHQDNSRISYYRFDISAFVHSPKSGDYMDKEIKTFISPMLAFVMDAISSGKSVLVHCLAGAHRAGTTGIALLMVFGEMNQNVATATAKRLRDVINPIGNLPNFLSALERSCIKLKK